jgi:outer membrane protein OmpA-like peptidoglycan-associated protein
MASNLIELARGYLTSEVVRRIGGELGESPDRVEKAIEAGIPSILAGVVKMASSGVNRLFEMLKQEPSELAHLGGLDGVFGNLGSLLSGGSMESLIKYGQTVLGALFGGKLGSIVDLITRSSGIKASSASSLLGMLAPLLMGVLRKETVSRGASPASLTDLLMGQRDAIAKLAPAGLSNALGLKSLTDLGAVADPIETAGTGVAPGVGRAVAAGQGGSSLRWAVPLVLLAAALLGLYYWSSGRGEPPQNPAQPPNLAQAAGPVSDVAKTATGRATPGTDDAGKPRTEDGRALIETTSQRVSLSLPGNIKLDVPANSYLQGLVQSLTDGAGTREPKSFVADDLTFEGTTTRLAPDSATAINSLATILKAFRTAKLKVEGHTDNVGDPVQNKKIALDRATAVKDALVKAGAPDDRILVEGVGPARPVASNDSEEGRAKNRRVELTVVSR